MIILLEFQYKKIYEILLHGSIGDFKGCNFVPRCANGIQSTCTKYFTKAIAENIQSKVIAVERGGCIDRLRHA